MRYIKKPFFPKEVMEDFKKQFKPMRKAKITWLSERGDKLGVHILHKGRFYDGYLTPAKPIYAPKNYKVR